MLAPKDETVLLKKVKKIEVIRKYKDEGLRSSRRTEAAAFIF